MQIYPEQYDQLELSTEEKSFLRSIERAFSSEENAYYVLHINPRKLAGDDGTAELFDLLVVPQGVFLFRFFNATSASTGKIYVENISNPIVYENVYGDIQEKLAESRYLVDENDVLIFTVNICFVMSNIDYLDIRKVLTPQINEFCQEHVVFRDTIQELRKIGSKVLLNMIKPLNKINENLVNCIFQRLCPEITIPRKFFIDDKQSIDINLGDLTDGDRSVQSYRLDNRQINIVNKIAKGNQLILACAGSGKSVLLIAKCFKLASLNPNEDFLIVCYNRNLFYYYEWAIAQAGFNERNVKCRTFYGLCNQLLKDNSIPLPNHYMFSKNDENQYYEKLFNVANSALESLIIKERFYGIFIDEVQIFKPEWYRFCFNLLKSKNTEDHFFVIAGDKSQDIKNSIKNGNAPWQGCGKDYPEYRGKTLPIEINYRNSKPINTAIDRFVVYAKQYGKEIGADLTSDPELFLRGTAFREGNKPQIKEINDYSNEGEARAICDSVNDLIKNEKFSEVDIAIILYNKNAPYTTKGWKTHYYELLPDIYKYFEEHGWEEPTIMMSHLSDGTTYGSRRGITITSIEGSLGLDFKGVILAGLRPLGTHEKARTEEDFQSGTEEERLDRLVAYRKNINFIYTGCTRAKDELRIILSAPVGESVYMDLIRESMR